MMANILDIGAQPWTVSGSCNETTGVISAVACGVVFGTTICPAGYFTADCTYNSDYQAAGYQTGCTGIPLAQGKASEKH